MKAIFKLTFLIIFLLATQACNSFLDQVPDDRQTIEEVFQKKRPSEEYLANIYSFVPDESDQWNGNPWVGNVDEIHVAWAKWTVYQLNIGNWTPGSSPFYKWQNYYNGIRSATYFMNHIDGNAEILNIDGQGLIDQYKAEARFLRALYYFMIIRQYGPCVLLGDTEIPADATGGDLQRERSSFDECVEYIASEFAEAAKVLPVVNSHERDFGRATKGAALAFRARLLLYAASPLYNGNTAQASFRNKDGKQLISQVYDKEKWKRAADAAKEVIALNSYQLYQDETKDPIKSYRGVLLTPWNSEMIFGRKGNDLWNWDYNCSLRSAGGWNGVAPLQEMVDDYFMKDGKSIQESALYSEGGTTNGIYNMYVDREPRFYASILFHGTTYKGGNITKDPIGVELNYSGRDGKKNGGEDYSHTGYLVIKGVSPETNRLTGTSASRPFVLMRLGEVYLNYAEALAEYGGNDTEALHYLNLIRRRAGIPEYGSKDLPVPTGAALIQQIRRERRIELAFESHRWFDVRRWKIVDTIMGDQHGMNVDGDNNEFFRRTVIANYAWRQAYYWFPLAQYEMDRGLLLVQNPGW
ncbi:RagB/SusD family nutrient uptake outer membrane protein [Sphingobacterium puteale]|uniref:RagB/SusD family nutrient uptake outer membrane protein n=1 Tax=Sphingobacterium puteale TaxID=2420510 RepID=A0A420VUX5_9SPHI|nr:RagB/SusD family nutrient uptake outer membrane protein [Sphingobacterium puteale]RKO70146.1 RagB/SusD family nutrient uptake outer membrane protein [Sphingobacterium puteale]